MSSRLSPCAVISLSILLLGGRTGPAQDSTGKNPWPPLAGSRQSWVVERTLSPNSKAGRDLAQMEEKKIRASKNLSEEEKTQQIEKWRDFFTAKFANPVVETCDVTIYVSRDGAIHAEKIERETGHAENYFWETNGKFVRVLPLQEIALISRAGDETLTNFLPPLGLSLILKNLTPSASVGPVEGEHWILNSPADDVEKTVELRSDRALRKSIRFKEAKAPQQMSWEALHVTRFGRDGQIVYAETWHLKDLGPIDEADITFSYTPGPRSKVQYE